MSLLTDIGYLGTTHRTASLSYLENWSRTHDAIRERGAEMADTLPDASLEACLRRALAELTRPVVRRGERAARSTG